MIVLGACGDYIGYIVLLSGSLPKVKVHTLLVHPRLLEFGNCGAKA